MKTWMILLSLLSSLSLSYSHAEDMFDIQFPAYPELDLSYSMRSSENGVCIHLGYTRALKNSAQKAYYQKRGIMRRAGGGWDDGKRQVRVYRAQSMLVDADGQIKSLVKGALISSITCIE